jgi:hypothetical protein
MRKEAQQDQTIINTPDHNSSIDASTTQTDDRKLTSKVWIHQETENAERLRLGLKTLYKQPLLSQQIKSTFSSTYKS